MLVVINEINTKNKRIDLSLRGSLQNFTFLISPVCLLEKGVFFFFAKKTSGIKEEKLFRLKGRNYKSL